MSSDYQTFKTFQPIFVFHRDESYFPIRINDYLEGCSLYNEIVTKNKTKVGSLIKSGPLKPFDLSVAPHRSTLVLENWEIVHGDMACNELICHKHTAGNTTFYQYIPFYAYNGPSKLFKCFNVGAHQCDLEVVSCVLQDGIMTGYYLSQHGDQVWHSSEELTFEHGSEKPYIYVALGSHAHYATPGPHPRFCGAVYDMCDYIECGYHWTPNQLNIVVDRNNSKYNPYTMGYVPYQGDMGATHVSAFGAQGFWNGQDY